MDTKSKCLRCSLAVQIFETAYILSISKQVLIDKEVFCKFNAGLSSQRERNLKADRVPVIREWSIKKWQFKPQFFALQGTKSNIVKDILFCRWNYDRLVPVRTEKIKKAGPEAWSSPENSRGPKPQFRDNRAVKIQNKERRVLITRYSRNG